jgi:deoxycytidine triphosphate deaminase
MALNYEQIQHRGIITDAIDENYNNAVYDIRIGKIITMKGEEVDTYTIPPQGMIVVVSKERLTIPSDIVGYAHIRTGLSSRGIMAINIGIIDPGYSGNLASTLLNFGKDAFSLQAGERFLRTTFHAVQPVLPDRSADSKSVEYSVYLDRKKMEALKYMDEKFMSFDKEVSNSINKKFENIVRLSSFISVSFALLTFTISSIVKQTNPETTEGYEYQLKAEQAKYQVLEMEIKLLNRRLDLQPRLLPVSRPVAVVPPTQQTQPPADSLALPLPKSQPPN